MKVKDVVKKIEEIKGVQQADAGFYINHATKITSALISRYAYVMPLTKITHSLVNMSEVNITLNDIEVSAQSSVAVAHDLYTDDILWHYIVFDDLDFYYSCVGGNKYIFAIASQTPIKLH